MSSPADHAADLSSVNAEIRQLRAAGTPYIAFTKLICEVELRNDQPGLLGEVRKLLDEHFLSGDCLLLEAGNHALQLNSRQELPPELPKSHLPKPFEWLDEDLQILNSKWPSSLWLTQILVRSRLIQALLNDLSPESLKEELQVLLDAYADAWPNPSDDSMNLAKAADAKPALLATPNLPDGLSTMLVELGRSCGAAHPAWHFLAESVAYLYRPARCLDRAAAAETWVMLAEESRKGGGHASTETAWRPAKGLIAKLRVERVDHGCGAIYPHPLRAGYVRFDDRFAASIQKALQTVIRLDGIGEVNQSDYRWSLEWNGSMSFEESFEDRHRALQGPSAAAPFAMAIRATVRNEDLDAHVACTGQLAGDTMGEVGHVLRKAAAQGLADRQVTEVVVAHGQVVDSVGRIESPTKPPGWNLTLVPVDDFRAAYERAAKHARITRAVKRYLQARSRRLLDYLCHPYVRPSICRRKDVVERDAQSEDDWYERIDDKELSQLFAGQPSAKRIQLFADSGFGKSTLLVELEGTIAETDGPLVPVRVGAGFEDVLPGTDQLLHLPLLDDDLFRGSREQVAKNLIQRLVWYADEGPSSPETTIKESDLCDWLQRKLDYGEILFLFDAADQTAEQPVPVAAFLKTCRNCAAIVSGRPETQRTKDRLWCEEQWDTLYSRGFDQSDWARYFAADSRDTVRHFDALVTRYGSNDWWLMTDFRDVVHRAYCIWQNEEWQPLLRPPILADQVKKLERENKLPDSTSRYDLYTVSLAELVAKGMDSLNATRESRHREEDWTTEEVMDSILAPIAWRMLQVELSCSADGVFRGQVVGKAYEQLKASRREELDPITFNLLWQIGVTTRMAILDQDGKGRMADAPRAMKRFADLELGGLSWRHLSFFEYFVGRAIAAKPQEYERLAERYARTPAWRWPFRFALSCLAVDAARSDDLASLAECLMKFGNTHLVHEAVTLDHVALDAELDALCRWFEHQNSGLVQSNPHEPPPGEAPPMTPRVLAILANAFRPEYRDSYYLYAGWELLDRALNDPTLDITLREGANVVRRSFLAEFPNLIKAGDPISLELNRSFVRCPPLHKRAPDDEDYLPFLQGTQGLAEDEYRGEDEDPHRVVVSPFELMDFLVTNAQFERMAPRHQRIEFSETDEQPVTGVTWFEARIFAIWAVAALPTESQWEYAARAGAHSQFCRIADPHHPDGYRDLKRKDELELVANRTSHVDGTTPRGRYMPNWWGLYDLLGNVLEWCGDWYSADYYRELSPTIAKDPTGPDHGTDRVIRGGDSPMGSCCAVRPTANRNYYPPWFRQTFTGFRLKRS